MSCSECNRKMETDRCKKLVSMIQQLESTETEELFKMLHANGCKYTSNNHGVFLNLSWLSEEILQKIETYVAFCFRSKSEVHKYESLCDVLNRNIQQTKKKGASTDVPMDDVPTPAPSTVDKKVNTPSRVSSSMKFYLLKKRYAKQVIASGATKNDLEVEKHST